MSFLEVFLCYAAVSYSAVLSVMVVMKPFPSLWLEKSFIGKLFMLKSHRDLFDDSSPSASWLRLPRYILYFSSFQLGLIWYIRDMHVVYTEYLTLINLTFLGFVGLSALYVHAYKGRNRMSLVQSDTTPPDHVLGVRDMVIAMCVQAVSLLAVAVNYHVILTYVLSLV